MDNAQKPLPDEVTASIEELTELCRKILARHPDHVRSFVVSVDYFGDLNHRNDIPCGFWETTKDPQGLPCIDAIFGTLEVATQSLLYLSLRAQRSNEQLRTEALHLSQKILKNGKQV
jgi:hypothetical protein